VQLKFTYFKLLEEIFGLLLTTDPLTYFSHIIECGVIIVGFFLHCWYWLRNCEVLF